MLANPAYTRNTTGRNAAPRGAGSQYRFRPVLPPSIQARIPDSGAAPIDPNRHSPSALCFSSGQGFSLSNEIDGRLVNLANLICAIVAIAILIALIVLV
jgi:hypothetical protein